MQVSSGSAHRPFNVLVASDAKDGTAECTQLMDLPLEDTREEGAALHMHKFLGNSDASAVDSAGALIV